jgi:hypothetical protein
MNAAEIHAGDKKIEMKKRTKRKIKTKRNRSIKNRQRTQENEQKRADVHALSLQNQRKKEEKRLAKGSVERWLKKVRL